jgi:membrane-associated phospholipid phosphatase
MEIINISTGRTNAALYQKCRYILRKIIFYILLLGNCSSRLFAQDSSNTILISKQDSLVKISPEGKSFHYKNLVIPGVFIAYGVASLEIPGLKQLNFSTRNEILEDKPTRTEWDNYTQYVPALMVYGLNAAGIKGKHNFRDRTILYATSQLISAAFVFPLKYIVKEERPDGSNTQSFPSGHAATAFSSAQFMFREYKDTNLWLSLSGYTFAVFTGVYRAVNNKHWVGDVVAGAGFGMLSTELSYWLYPALNTLLSGKRRNHATMVAPFYKGKTIGIGLVKTF